MPATIADLKRYKGKSELINGQIVIYDPDGGLPGLCRINIMRKLADYVDELGVGIVGSGSLGFVVPELKNGRQSFCADVSYYSGPLPSDPWGFIAGAPDFAVEVRNHTDYYAGAERLINMKRADYFEAGTHVVWDVDPIDSVVRVYKASKPDMAEVFGLGQEVHAEPVLPGWKLPVARIFV